MRFLSPKKIATGKRLFGDSMYAITIQLIHGYVKRSDCFELNKQSPGRMAARERTLGETQTATKFAKNLCRGQL